MSRSRVLLIETEIMGMAAITKEEAIIAVVAMVCTQAGNFPHPTFN